MKVVKRKCYEQLNCRIWWSEFVFSVILSGLILKCLIGNFGLFARIFRELTEMAEREHYFQ
jgi:hypothetical protein